eukprot:TRINITY_DN992_c0_g1_i3.p1 TRINITY_DN992_c0_g1~~TRINITY_DN992_c0_g1_i3.p1  ORF type:complete len:467 (-),score=44.87 TRINITY_DN992_c0_g1_i3:1650-3050(-)
MVEAIINRVYLVERKVNGVVVGLQKPPEPVKNVFDGLSYLIYQLGATLGNNRLMTTEEWIDRCPAHRRKVYKTAYENLLLNGWDDKWYEVKAFVKASREDASLNKACRLICPSYEECIVVKGPYIKSVEESIDGGVSLYKAIDTMWSENTTCLHPVCTKGLTQDEVGALCKAKWDEFSEPVYVCFDCSRFSQHTREDACTFAYTLVWLLFPDSKDHVISQKVKAQAVVADEDGHMFKVACTLPAMLLDGSPETAMLAHIVINCIFVDYFKTFDEQIEPLDCGDDFGAFCEKGTINNGSVVNHLRRYGYTLKVEQETEDFSKVCFCQCSPLVLESRITMIRAPTCIVKDALMMCQRSEVDDRLLAVGLGGCHVNYGVPVYHNFYRALVRLSGLKNMKKKHVSFLYSTNYLYYQAVVRDGKRMDATVPVVYTQQDRYNFWLTTDITPQEQIALEFSYDNVEHGTPVPW